MRGILIILLLLFLFSIPNEERYNEIFEDTYLKAVEFVEQNKSYFVKEFEADSIQLYEKMAIVFPEIMKYSLYKDIIETSALELLYVNYGKEQADFSIGYFQMKPSFIESIECEIVSNESLYAKYYELIEFFDTSAKEARRQRIERLKSIEWQIKYLNCFYDYLSIKYKDVKWESAEKKIRFYSTAYNYNFKASQKEIETWMYQRVFPYGINKNKPQYAYSDIAVFYFKSRVKYKMF